MKKIILAAVFAALSLPVNAAPVAVRVAPVRVSVSVRAPVTVKSVAPIKSVTPIKAAPVSAVKAATPVKAPAPTVTKPDPLVKPAQKIATSPVAATTATTAALVATSASANNRRDDDRGISSSMVSNVATGAALTAIATMAWIEYTDQEVEAVKADGSTAVMNVNPQFTVLCDSTQYAQALQWRDQCRNHGQIQSSYCAVVAFNRLCDPATPEQVAGRTRVPDYTNVFFK